MGKVCPRLVVEQLRRTTAISRNLVKGYDQGLRLGDEDEWLMAEMIQAISERERGPMIPEE